MIRQSGTTSEPLLTPIAYGKAGASVPIGVDLDQPLPVASRDGFFTASASFNRPADTVAYAVGDRVANATANAVVLEFLNVARATGEAVRIETVRLRKTGPILTNASFRVHLFRTLPTVNVNDNGVFNSSNTLAVADIAGHIGSVDITLKWAGVAGARGEASFSPGKTCEAAGTSGHETSLWAVIEALAAYTPVSGETFTLTLEAARS